MLRTNPTSTAGAVGPASGVPPSAPRYAVRWAGLEVGAMIDPMVPHFVVMGVSGCGKSTVATRLADRLGANFLEGDSIHPPQNVAKMSAGTPLTDEDRWPWLGMIREWLEAQSPRTGIVTCSALRRAYRDVLRGAGEVSFIHVAVGEEELARRMKNRAGHFMPASLLASQLAAVEPLGNDEPGFTVDGSGTSDEVVDEILSRLTIHVPPRRGPLPNPSQ